MESQNHPTRSRRTGWGACICGRPIGPAPSTTGGQGSCFGYDCTKDGRIWADFEKKVINPDLKRELDKLQSGPAGGPPEGEADRRGR